MINFLLYFFIIILIYSSLVANISSTIIIPFSITNQNYELISKEIDLMSYLHNLSLYSDISIGSPIQQIKMFIKFDKIGFSIPNNAYNHENSETYKEIEGNQIIYEEIEYNGTFSSDDITMIDIDSFNLSDIFQNTDCDEYIFDEKYKKIFKNITFINTLSDEVEYKNYGYIGFKFPDKNKLKNYNFVSILKNKNIIANYSWTLLFETKNDNNIITIDNFNKIKGKLIIGDELYNYYPNKFMNNISNSVNIVQRNGILNWNLDMTNIYLNDLKLYISTQVELKPDSALHFGSLAFKLNLDTKYFSPLFNQSICQQKNMTLFPNIIYYICDNSKKGNDNISFDMKQLPNITFVHKTLKGNFTLTYKDLFIQDFYNKNIFYFLIVFDRNIIFNFTEDRLILGMKFFEKYHFEFDNDKKLIRYYDIIENINEDKNIDNHSSNDKNEKDYLILIYIGLIILFGAVLFILGMLFQKKIIKIPRKARANELDEDFEYKAKNEEKNESIGLGINE